MSVLSKLHHGIEQVRNFRKQVRIGSGLSVFFALLIAGLLVMMALDVASDMSKLERAVCVALLAILGHWAARKYVAPTMGIEESDVEIASLIERRHNLHTDLVGALQFSDAGRTQFGSDELREAAVDDATRLSSKLEYMEGFSQDELNKRLIIFTAAVVALVGVLFVFPGHSRAFFNRLFLGSAHYPTNTRIVEIVTPGKYAPFGLPLTFDLKVEGDLPESGTVRIKTLTTGLATVLDLTPDADNANRYTATLDRAGENFTYQVFLGDAYTDSRKVTLTPLPVVYIAFNIETPEYAKEAFAKIQALSRSPIALEGSRVIPVVTADKKLKSATITVSDEAVDLVPEGDVFTLKGSAHPLQYVTETLRWSVQVVDSQGLSLEQPMAGVLQVRPDQPPNIGIATSTRLIWAGAAPTIRYKATDDYGLDKLKAFVTLQRWQDGSTEASPETSLDVATSADHAVELEGSYQLSLDKLNLQKGDRLYVSFAVEDYRGDLGGETVRSEPIVLEVSDREGVLEALRDFDAEMERKLDQIINAQLGIGESP